MAGAYPACRIVWVHTFGERIGNSDMHLRNVSPAPTDRGFRLLLFYDVLPTGRARHLRDLDVPQDSGIVRYAAE